MSDGAGQSPAPSYYGACDWPCPTDPPRVFLFHIRALIKVKFRIHHRVTGHLCFATSQSMRDFGSACDIIADVYWAASCQTFLSPPPPPRKECVREEDSGNGSTLLRHCNISLDD